MERGKMDHWKVTSSRKVHENPYFSIRKDICTLPHNNKKIEYYVKEGVGSSIIFGMTKEKKVVIGEQYRHPLKRMSIGFPAGSIEKNEEPEKTAAREFLEETGYEAQTITFISKLAYNPGTSEEHLYIYFSDDVIFRTKKRTLDSSEDIKIRLVPLHEIQSFVKQGKIDCALCVSTLYFAFQHLSEISKK